MGRILTGPPSPTPAAAMSRHWQAQHAIHLPGILSDRLAEASPWMAKTETLVLGVLEDRDWDELLQHTGILQRLGEELTWTATVFDDTDPQAIARLEFEDAHGREVWMKASWLSLYEEDPSLRFRFSHGLDRYEDVAADPGRQALSNRLCERVFPETRLLVTHERLARVIEGLIEARPRYVERIVYFNAPEGGAQFHQDVERGHEGVVYAQLSGETFWFALPKSTLAGLAREVLEREAATQALAGLLGADELRRLRRLSRDPAAWLALMDDPAEEALPVLLNQSPELAARLVQAGHAYHLRPGDALLLPQKDLDHCCWHSVFCLGEEMGEALSFAIRRD